jgi:hypothetical protein
MPARLKPDRAGFCGAAPNASARHSRSEHNWRWRYSHPRDRSSVRCLAPSLAQSFRAAQAHPATGAPDACWQPSAGHALAPPPADFRSNAAAPAPASSRLLFAASRSWFSAAESSSGEDPAARLKWGEGCSLPTPFSSEGKGVFSAAAKPRLTTTTANETPRARSIVVCSALARGAPAKLK